MGSKRKCLMLSDRLTGFKQCRLTRGPGNQCPKKPHRQPCTRAWSDLTLTHGAHSALTNQPSPALGLWSSVHTHPMDLMTQGEQPQSVYCKAPGKSTAPTPRTGEDEVVTWTQTFSQHSVYTTLSSWTAYLLVNENVRII